MVCSITLKGWIAPTMGTQIVHRGDDAPSSPVVALPHDEQDRRGPQPGIGLCLSGGGYCAMLFHLGSLWRLNELGYLPKLSRVSSVSGGSITSARLALVWSKLDFDSEGIARAFGAEVATPIRRLASHTIDVPSIIVGAILPVINAADRIEKAYKKYLFGDATMADLPIEGIGIPRFIINAASMQTGALFRFSQPYLADWRLGINRNTKQVPLARAVAASSAFPPVLSPMDMELEPGGFEPCAGADLHNADPAYTTRIVLTDGGTYDNLGLETVFKRYVTVLASDAGAALPTETKPHEDWIRHGVRASEMLLNQTVSIRKRQLIAAFEGAPGSEKRDGAYWSIRSELGNYKLPDAWPFDQALASKLAETPTRLEKLDDDVQESLINWGYVACDTAMRTWVAKTARRPTRLPCARSEGTK